MIDMTEPCEAEEGKPCKYGELKEKCIWIKRVGDEDWCDWVGDIKVGRTRAPSQGSPEEDEGDVRS